MPDRILEPLRRRFRFELRAERQVIVDRARDDVEIEPLGRARLLIHEKRQALRRRIGQPFFDAEAVALGLGDLLALLVQEQLVIETLRRTAAEDAADLARQIDGRDQILARHLVIDTERMPAHAPIGLPLQLAAAAGHRRFHLAAILLLIDNGAGRRVIFGDRRLQHAPRLLTNRQERRIGRSPLLAQGRQHHFHDLGVVAQHFQQGRIEPARHVPIGRGLKFVFEAEGIEEAAQHRVVVMAEAFMRAERIRHLGQRLAEMLRQHLLVRHVGRHLAQAIHVVGEGEQPRRNVAQPLKGAPHHGGAHDLAEGADMRQAGWAIAGLEQHIAFGRRRVLVALHQLARLLERPGARGNCILLLGTHHFPRIKPIATGRT